MNEAGQDPYKAFELLGRVSDSVGVGVLGEAVDFARDEWAAGRPGPVITSAEGVVPPYSITLGEQQVDILWGGERASVPVAALTALMGAEVQRA
jgi:hypothetical protein